MNLSLSKLDFQCDRDYFYPYQMANIQGVFFTDPAPKISYCQPLRERFIENKKKKKLTNVSFALTPTYVQ